MLATMVRDSEANSVRRARSCGSPTRAAATVSCKLMPPTPETQSTFRSRMYMLLN